MKTKALPVLLILFFLFYIGCSPDDDPNNGVHFRESFFNLNDSIREYKFNNTPSEVSYIKSFPWEIIQNKVSQDILDSSDIQYNIYTSIKNAELAMVENLDMSNLYMQNIIDYPLSIEEIGDNCWHQLLVGTILFIRNNVFVDISIDIQNSSFDSTDVLWLAEKIDQSIIDCEKVKNVNQIPAPEITSIDAISTLPEDWGEFVEIKISASDPNSSELSFRPILTGLALYNHNGIFNIYLDNSLPLYESNDKNKYKIMVWVWNEKNIVSLGEKEFSFNNN